MNEVHVAALKRFRAELERLTVALSNQEGLPEYFQEPVQDVQNAINLIAASAEYKSAVDEHVALEVAFKNQPDSLGMMGMWDKLMDALKSVPTPNEY